MKWNNLRNAEIEDADFPLPVVFGDEIAVDNDYVVIKETMLIKSREHLFELYKKWKGEPSIKNGDK